MPDLPQQITVDDVTLTLAVERKRVKNVNARLRGSTLYIGAPPGMSSERLEDIAGDLARKLLRRELLLASKVASRFPQPPQVERALFVTN